MVVRTYLEAQLWDSQQGFRQQRAAWHTSCRCPIQPTPHDGAWSLPGSIYEAPMHATFADFSKAFDLVNHVHEILWAGFGW